MLGKVFKYEMKTTAGFFLPLFIGFAAVTLLGKLSFESSLNLFSDSSFATVIMGIFLTLYAIYMVALFVMAFVFIVTNFYKTMLGEQGYLTNTLPVKTSTLIQAKLFSAVIWEIASIALALLSLLVFPLGHFQLADIHMIMEQINAMFQDISQYFGIPWLLFTISGIVSLISAPLTFYASAAAGHLFRKRRIIWSVAAYFIITTVTQIFEGTFITMFNNGGSATYQTVSDILHSGLLFDVIFSILMTIGLYFFTNYVISKRLNLD